jgi:single-strand DNA-binding protein
MIKLQFIGYLGNDAVRKDVNGTSLLKFRAAHTRRFTNQEGVKHEVTTWIDCAYWDPTNVAPYLTTGTRVYVEGTPAVEKYISNAGEPMAGLKLRVSWLELLGKPDDGVKKQNEANEEASPVNDLPF